MRKNIIQLFCFVCIFVSSCLISQESDDPYLWLEDVEGVEALEWVRAQNEATVGILKHQHDFQDINTKILEILNSRERIIYPSIVGEYLYIFWQDAQNERGLWQRTPIKEYLKENPEWETVIDFDILSENEGEKWSYKGASFLYPNFDLCLLKLSSGGSDAVEIREFDLVKKAFVVDGFHLPEAKGSASWIDKNTLIVSTNFGEGTTTSSGYPRITKIWRRGDTLKEAKIVFQGDENDVGVWGWVDNTPEQKYVMVSHSITYYTSNVFVLHNDNLVKIDIPEDAQFHGFFKNHMFIELKSDWNVENTKYKQGMLLCIDFDAFLLGDRNFEIIFEPKERTSLARISNTKDYILLDKLSNVKSELVKCFQKNDKWVFEKVNAPDFGSISITTTDMFSNQYFFSYENFIEPTSLYYVPDNDQNKIKVESSPHFFNSNNLEVKQFEVESNDKTQIPYFVVCSKETIFDGSNPTLLYGYGGFEISMQPFYDAVVGVTWLERGGIYVLANIRGGGEFGPKWHQAAIKENKQRAYDDFISVSEDLIKRGITTPKHLGIWGDSNGGLLVGVAFTQRPELFNAVVCEIPLLDMKRYNKLLAGASWMAEYGNPDVPEEWDYIKKYSPYHNLYKSNKYPKVLFTTTTRDDRVHPGHARKMAAKMRDQGHDFFYFENTEGGHGSGVTNEQIAFVETIKYIYLLKMLQ